jgi:two-component system, NarL family, sensor histidine kinase UhpB
MEAGLANSVAVARALVHERVDEAVEEGEAPDRLTALLATLEQTNGIHAIYVPEASEPPRPPQANGFLAWLYRAQPIVTVEPLPRDGKIQGRIVLTTDPAEAMAGVRRAIEISLSAIALVSLSALVLIAFGLTHSLGGLRVLKDGLQRIGRGDYAARLPVSGPPDIAQIATQFNRMAAQLAESRATARKLSAQLATVQEQERRDIARDLHDELGPCLLAASLDVAALQRLQLQGDAVQALECAAGLGDVLERMRSLVRRMIDRLHLDPVQAPALGEAVEELVRFWAERCPDLHWRVAPKPAWGCVVDTQVLPLLRVLQEAVSNAVRHSGATEIDLDCRAEPGAVHILVADDGRGIGPDRPAGTGFKTMTQRIEALGGEISIGPGAERGTRVRIALPLGETATETVTLESEEAGR